MFAKIILTTKNKINKTIKKKKYVCIFNHTDPHNNSPKSKVLLNFSQVV